MSLILLIWMLSSPLVTSTLTDVQLEIAMSLANHFRAAFCIFTKDLGFSIQPSKFLTTFLNFQHISEFMNENSLVKPGGKTMIFLKETTETLQYLEQLSQNTSLSSATWILFSNSSFQSELFQKIYIPFDCEFIHVGGNNTVFHFTEIYQIAKKTNIERHNFGNWTKESGLVVDQLHFYFRRNNLKGHHLTAIIKNNPPYISIEEDGNGKPHFKGYLYEIWNELEFRLNFRTEFPEIYFDKEPSEILKNENVDFALARISIVASTFDVMDFSQPIHEARSYMFGHRPGSELDWDSYLRPFSRNTWFVTILWMFSSSLALAILYKKAWDFGTSEREANYYIFTFPESLLTVFRAICMQGSDVTPKSSSCRLFFLSIYLTALVVTSAFSAVLFSLLTIPKPKSPFSSLHEVLNNNKFHIGFPSDPEFYKLVEDFSSTLSPSDQVELLKKLGDSKTKIPMTPDQGLQQICHDKFYVFMFDLPNVLYLMQNTPRACQDKILPSGPPLFTELIGFGFKKQSPYKELINFHLIRMKNEGILKRLLLNYWPPQIPTIQATWVRITLSDISPILYMFALGAVLSTIFLHGEKLFIYFRKNKSKKTNVKSHKLLNDLVTERQILLGGFSKSGFPDWAFYYKINKVNK